MSSMGDRIFECPCTETSSNAADFYNLDCGCVRCLPCLGVEVEIGLKKKDWPPKCTACRVDFDLDSISGFLKKPQLERWQEKNEEYNDDSPLYCARPDCSRYLPKSITATSENFFACPRCAFHTCSLCKSLKSWHLTGNKCPDMIEPETLREMREKGFQPCPWCKQMIERIDGCNRMHCEPCGRNFCFGCGKKTGRSGMFCACRVDQEWIHDALNEMDPDRQQDILDQISNGRLLPRSVRTAQDLKSLPPGRPTLLGYPAAKYPDLPVEEWSDYERQMRIEHFFDDIYVEDYADFLCGSRNNQGHELIPANQMSTVIEDNGQEKLEETVWSSEHQAYFTVHLGC